LEKTKSISLHQFLFDETLGLMKETFPHLKITCSYCQMMNYEAARAFYHEGMISHPESYFHVLDPLRQFIFPFRQSRIN
jgi:hypothetical protein